MSARKRTIDYVIFNIIGYTVITIFSLLCLIPFIMVISSSFTSEEYILTKGYSFFPGEFSLEGYRMALHNPQAILRAYGTTILVTVIGTCLGVFINTMTGYCLQKRDFPWRNGFSFFFFFTTLFNGGLVPWYILCIRYLGFKNQLYALFLPYLVSVWYILLVKGFMRGIPFEITESAKIDGAGDFKTFIRIILPLSTPVIATIGLFTALFYWNDWYACMLFISDEKKFTLQYFLYKLLSSIEAMKDLLIRGGTAHKIELPTESLKMAMTVIVTGPIIFLYPFVQKYFVKGLTIGAIKG